MAESDRRMTHDRRQLSWRGVVAYIVLFIVVGLLAAGIIANSNSISDQVVITCESEGARAVQQLNVDFAVFKADTQAAAAFKDQRDLARTNPQLYHVLNVQARIRSEEATNMLIAMNKIAAVHIDSDLAPLLPQKLASIVAKTGFQCTNVDRRIG